MSFSIGLCKFFLSRFGLLRCPALRGWSSISAYLNLVVLSRILYLKVSLPSLHFISLMVVLDGQIFREEQFSGFNAKVIVFINKTKVQKNLHSTHVYIFTKL